MIFLLPPLKDLTGQKFDRLLVLARDFDYAKQHNLSPKRTYWKCQCDCGNIITVRGNALTTGNTRSCGCYRNEKTAQINLKSLAGQHFDNIEVLQDLNELGTDNRRLHLCRCGYCGSLFKASTSALTSRHIASCGCLISKGEQKLIQLFVQHNIKYIKEYSFHDLRSDTETPLRFDFYLPDYQLLIEYQGVQHYNPNSKYYSEGGQQHDQDKREYCKQHNLFLIEIPYTDFSKISYDYLQPYLSKKGYYG